MHARDTCTLPKIEFIAILIPVSLVAVLRLHHMYYVDYHNGRHRRVQPQAASAHANSLQRYVCILHRLHVHAHTYVEDVLHPLVTSCSPTH